jgi:hypothetical protein
MEKQVYVILSKKCNIYGHGFVNPLGHEIHLTRFILFDLLQKKLIDLNSTIVTLYDDRFFLYSKVFRNLITWDDYVTNHKKETNTEIDLTYYSPVKTRYEQIKEFDEINYKLNNFERTLPFINYINDMNFYDLITHSCYSDIIIEKFIVIHWRTNIIGLSKNKSDSLLKIINNLRKKTDLKIIIFSVENIDIHLKNVYFINNLQIYASFLHHENCDLLISEWSGGGQLSQYCCNSKIIYYFDDYPSNDYEIHCENYQNVANLKNNIFNSWDFKCTTNCKRIYYKTLDEIIFLS